MTPADADRFGVALFALAEIFSEALSENRLRLYFKALDDLSIEQVERAIEACARSSKFFPRPSELRETVLGSPSDQAMLAWTRVLTAIGCHGPRSSVDFRDPLIHAVVDSLGGWHVYAAEMPSSPKEQAFRMADFVKLYRAFSVKLPGRVRAYLPGLSEVENKADFGKWTHGLSYRDPVLVLDADGRGVLAKREALREGPPRMPAVEMGKLLRLPPSASEQSA